MRVGLALLVSCVLVGHTLGEYGAGIGAPHQGNTRDPPSNDIQPGTDIGLDRIQVVSSALRVTPQRDRHRGRREPAPGTYTWRRPKRSPAPDTFSWHRPKRSPAPDTFSWHRPKRSPAPDTFSWHRPKRSPAPDTFSWHRPKRSPAPDTFSWRRPKRAPAPGTFSWRRPRQHQFITKEDRVSPPTIIRVYPPTTAPAAARRTSRRIIYYATLPEIVRPPGWYDQRLDYYDARPSTLQQYSQPINYNRYNGYQGYHNSDNEVTRVQSNIIDVTPPRTRFSSSPKFTIIDVDPPYNYNYNRYNSFNPYQWQRRPPLSPSYDRPEPSLEPVKLEIPTSSMSNSNSTDTDNSTRLIPEVNKPASRSPSKFVT